MQFEEIINSIQNQFGEESILETNTDNLQPFIVVDRSVLKSLCQFLFENEQLYFDYLSCITGIDNGEKEATMEVIYHLYSIPFDHHLIIKVILTRDLEDEQALLVPSIESIWKTANWHEREVYDLFGIQFEGHPDMRRILLPANWEGFPLRKDYKTQDYYHGIKVDY